MFYPREDDFEYSCYEKFDVPGLARLQRLSPTDRLSSAAAGNVELFPNGDRSNQGEAALTAQSSVLTLAELSAKTVSKYLPYSYVEEKCTNMPEHIAKRIMFWSFPRRSEDVDRYYVDIEEYDKVWHRRRTDIRCAVQVGFCVQGIFSDGRNNFHTCLTFDRCVITSVKCSCDQKDILWCIHAKELATFRRVLAHSTVVHMPIFPSINKLDRCQLQKLLQYLLCEFTGIVPSVYNEIHRVIRDGSTGVGIKDPTAFSGMQVTPTWFLDTENIISKCTITSKGREMFDDFRHDVIHGFVEELLKRVVEMLSANDRNGLRILQCLLQVLNEYCEIDIPEKLLKLWTFALAAPNISKEVKSQYCELLNKWRSYGRHRTLSSDLEAMKVNALLPYENNFPQIIDTDTPFIMPLCAGRMSWDIPLLKCILSGESVCSIPDPEVDTDQQYIWREHLPTSCVRIRALMLDGCHSEATRLSLAVARAIKDQVKSWKKTWSEFQLSIDTNDIDEGLVRDIIRSSDGEWMNISVFRHRIEPLDILFQSLTGFVRSTAPRALNSSDKRCLQLLIESLLIIISQRIMPDEIYWGKTFEKQWMRVIFYAMHGKWKYKNVSYHLDSNAVDIGAIRDIIRDMWETGPFTSCGDFPQTGALRYYYSLVMIGFVNSCDRDLAVKIALNCLQYAGTESLMGEYREEERDYFLLLLFVISVFPENVANEALEATLKLPAFCNIENTVFNLLRSAGTQFAPFLTADAVDLLTCELRVTLKDAKPLVYAWLLRKLHSTLSPSRKLNGNLVLEAVSCVGFEQAMHLLQQWEQYFNFSESLALPFEFKSSQYCGEKTAEYFVKIIFKKEERDFTFYHFSSEKSIILQIERYKLVLRLLENVEGEEKDLVIEHVENLFHTQKQFYRFGVLSGNEPELKKLLFEIGCLCAKRKPREFILRHLPSPTLDEQSRSVYHYLLMGAFERGEISLDDILTVTGHSLTIYRHAFRCCSDVTRVSETCRNWVSKLCLKKCWIPANYKWTPDSSAMINEMIDIAKEADETGEDEATEVSSLIIERVQHTPFLYRVVEGCYKSVSKYGRKPSWLKVLLERSLLALEMDTDRRSRGFRLSSLPNHNKRLSQLKVMLQYYTT